MTKKKDQKKISLIWENFLKIYHQKFPQKIYQKFPSSAAIFFLIIGLLMTFFAGVLIFKTVFQTNKVENFIPNKNLLALMQTESLSLPSEIRQKNPALQKKLDNFLLSIFTTDFQKTTSWRGEKFAIAFFKNSQNKNNLFWSIFLEIKDRKQAFDFLKNFLLKNEKLIIKQKDAYQIFSFPSRNFDCSFLEGYLACAQKKSSFFENFILVKKGQEKSIKDSRDFQKTNAQVSKNSLVKIFIRPLQIMDFFPTQYYWLKPMLEELKVGMLSWQNQENGLKLSAFFLKKQKEENIFTSLSKKISENLADFLPQKSIFFAHIKNTQKSLDYYLSHITLSDKNFNFFIFAKARAILENFFARTISLEDDLLPLFTDNFIIGLTQKQKETIPFLIIKTSDPVFAEEKRKKFILGFEKMLTSLSVEIINIEEDPDMKEAFPSSLETIKKQEDLTNGSLTTLKRASWQISLARKDKILIASSREEITKEIIQKINLPKFRRKTSYLSRHFPLRTFSAFDEVFAFSKDFLYFLPSKNIKKIVGRYFYFLEKFSGKIVKLPDALRIELLIDFKS